MVYMVTVQPNILIIWKSKIISTIKCTLHTVHEADHCSCSSSTTTLGLLLPFPLLTECKRINIQLITTVFLILSYLSCHLTIPHNSFVTLWRQPDPYRLTNYLIVKLLTLGPPLGTTVNILMHQWGNTTIQVLSLHFQNFKYILLTMLVLVVLILEYFKCFV